MIDWASVGTGALWTSGLAIIFATISYAHWRARGEGKRLRAVLGISGCQVTLDLGTTLVCMGLFFAARSTWERLAWAALTLLSATLAAGRWGFRRSGGATRS